MPVNDEQTTGNDEDVAGNQQTPQNDDHIRDDGGITKMPVNDEQTTENDEDEQVPQNDQDEQPTATSTALDNDQTSPGPTMNGVEQPHEHKVKQITDDEKTETAENNIAVDLKRADVVKVVIKNETTNHEEDHHDSDAEEKTAFLSTDEELKADDEPKSERTVTIADEETVKDDTTKRPCFARFIRHYRPILYGILIVITLSLVTWLIINNGVDVNTATVIGLVCFDMIMCAILMMLIGIPLIKAWTTKTWWLVFFLVYLSLIVDVFAIATYLTQKLLQIPLIIYGVVKVLLIYHSYCYAKVDGKHFMPAIISQYLTWQYIRRDTKMYKLVILYLICLAIQLVMFCIGSMAFILDEDKVDALFIVALIFFVWLINTPRHFISFMSARMLAKDLRQSERQLLTEDDDVFKIAFKETVNKFMTIVIGSFLVTLSPLFYFITNLMQGIRIITACLVIVCYREENDANVCACIANLIACVSVITNGIAWVTRKISKCSLRIMAKLILVIAGFLNVSFYDAIILQNNLIKTETKETYGSDMLYLDNVILSNNTHLCILISSIGAWCTYLIRPEVTVIGWVAAYCACRTVLELFDVILLSFLNAWFIEPRIIYEDKLLFAEFKIKIDAYLRTMYPNENDEFYEHALHEMVQEFSGEFQVTSGLQKTTDPTQISNVQTSNVQFHGVQLNAAIEDRKTGDIVATAEHREVELHVSGDTNHPFTTEAEHEEMLQLQAQNSVSNGLTPHQELAVSGKGNGTDAIAGQPSSAINSQ